MCEKMNKAYRMTIIYKGWLSGCGVSSMPRSRGSEYVRYGTGGTTRDGGDDVGMTSGQQIGNIFIPVIIFFSVVNLSSSSRSLVANSRSLVVL